MALETTTSSNKKQTPICGSSDGYVVGQSSTDYVGFYGATPVVRPSGAAQAVITDSSGGVANSSTGVAALTGTYNSTIIANALATIIAQNTALRLALVNLGLVKGAA
jgi:hypothetical protein